MTINEIKMNYNKIRESSELWDDFSYSGGDNYLNRYALAIQLQYDLKESDHELVKFLMKNETLCRENDKFQGIGNSLMLISYLLAKFKDPRDVLLFERAKCANFDTYCGYPIEFIFSAGVEKTCNYVESIELPEQNGYLFERKDELGMSYTEDQITTFFEEMSFDYPSNIRKESTISLLDRANLFKQYSECDRLFALLEEEIPSEFQTLYYYAKLLKKYERAIYYQSKTFDLANTPQQKASSLKNITELYCLDSKYDDAYEIAIKMKKYLNKFDDWKRIGLGRMITETWFNICLGFIKEKDLRGAAKSFKNADYMLKAISSHSLVLLKVAYECSLKLGRTKEINEYQILLDKEQERVNTMMDKVSRNG